MLVLQGDKNKHLDRTLLWSCQERGREGGGISCLRKALPSAQKACIYFFPLGLLSFAGYVNHDNHVNLPQLFSVAMLSSPWIAITVAGGPCFSIVSWLSGLILFTSTSGKWFRRLELCFATVDRIARVSFLFLLCLTESETTDSVPSDEENAEVSVFWIFSTSEEGLKNNILRYSSPFFVCISVYQWSIHFKNSWGRKKTQEGSREASIWMIIVECVSLQVLSSSCIQTTRRLICVMRCSGEPSTLPASLLL